MCFEGGCEGGWQPPALKNVQNAFPIVNEGDSFGHFAHNFLVVGPWPKTQEAKEPLETVF